MKLIQRTKPLYKAQHFGMPNQHQHILGRIKDLSQDAYLRTGTFVDEIVWDGTSYVFPNGKKKKSKSYGKGLFLFGMVRRDAKAYLASNPVKLPKKYPVNYTNPEFRDVDAKFGGVDMNHAYWRIAYNLGVITEKTYLAGLRKEFKGLRLSALSTMGASKTYRRIKAGVLTNEYVEVGGNKELQQVYLLVRYSCYKYMVQLMKLLGDEFICYKTDCIYFIESRQNRKKVRKFLDDHGLLAKDLYEFA